jgi:hypothetical protein
VEIAHLRDSRISSKDRSSRDHRRAWLTVSSQNRWSEAEELFAEVIAKRKEMLGEEHPDTIQSLINLATCYLFLPLVWPHGPIGHLGGPAPGVPRKWPILGAGPPKWPIGPCGQTRGRNKYTNQGRFEEAGELGTKIVEISEKKFGLGHKLTLGTMSNLAVALNMQGKVAEAETFLVKVVDTRRTLLGIEDPSTVSSILMLKDLYVERQQLKPAGDLLAEVVNSRNKTLGENHPTTLSTMIDLATNLSEQSRNREAEVVFANVTERGKMTLGEEHPITLKAVMSLAYLTTPSCQCINKLLNYSRVV